MATRAGLGWAAWLGCVGMGGAAVAEGTWVLHRLVEGSALLDDCPPCARPALAFRLRGTCEVRVMQVLPGATRMALRDIRWRAGGWTGEEWLVTGHGSLVVRGEGLQSMALDVVMASSSTNLARHFTNVVPEVLRAPPNLAADLESVERSPSHVFRMSLRTAPLRDLWFVTSHGFTPGRGGVPTGHRRAAGDVLSMDGHVVSSSGHVVGRLGIMPVVPPTSLGALDVLPGGRMVFSLREPVFSEALGPLTPGMLLASDGTVFRRMDDLLGCFGPVTWGGLDPGLDAVQVLSSGEVLFSTTTDVTWGGGKLGHGDVLSGMGHVHKRLKDILAPFGPTAWPGTDLEATGLDGWHEWPWGEGWFSVRQGFHSEAAGPVQAGDLLSDRGWVVYRNLELLERFQPLEDLADFGLEGVFGVTDVAVEPPATRLGWRRGPRGLALGASGDARAWQLEFAPVLGGRFLPVFPPSPWPLWEVPMDAPSGWYRVRAW